MNESVFKVGDKVRISVNSGYYLNGDALNPKHEIGIVHEVDSDDYVSVKWVAGTNCYSDSDLELVYLLCKDDTPSELEEAYARIDSLEELVSELSMDLSQATNNGSLVQQADCYRQMANLLMEHDTFRDHRQGSRLSELLETIKLLQDSYDNKENK